MDEETRLLTIMSNLTAARNFLLHQQPTDMIAVTAITERIVDAQGHLTAMSAPQKIQPLTPDEIQVLQDAIAILQTAIDQNAAATQILQAATKVANA